MKKNEKIQIKINEPSEITNSEGSLFNDDMAHLTQFSGDFVKTISSNSDFSSFLISEKRLDILRFVRKLLPKNYF